MSNLDDNAPQSPPVDDHENATSLLFSGAAVADALAWVVAGLPLIILDFKIGGFDVLLDTAGFLLILIGVTKIIAATSDVSLSSIKLARVLLVISLPLNVASDGFIGLGNTLAAGLGIVSAIGIYYIADAMCILCNQARVPVTSLWSIARVICGIGVALSVLSLAAGPTGNSFQLDQSQFYGLAALFIVLVISLIAATFWLLQRTRKELRAAS